MIQATGHVPVECDFVSQVIQAFLETLLTFLERLFLCVELLIDLQLRVVLQGLPVCFTLKLLYDLVSLADLVLDGIHHLVLL